MPSSSTTTTKAPLFESELVCHLLRQWAWGEISSVAVQELAQKAFRDQVTLLHRVGLSEDHIDPVLCQLASMGTNGRHPGNVHPQLMTFLGTPGLPAPHIISVPVKRMKAHLGSEETVIVDFPIFLPHVVFSHFYNHNRRRFDELFFGEVKDSSGLENIGQKFLPVGTPEWSSTPSADTAAGRSGRYPWHCMEMVYRCSKLDEKLQRLLMLSRSNPCYRLVKQLQ